MLMGGRRVQPFFPEGFDAVAGLAGLALSALTGLWLPPLVMCHSSMFSVEGLRVVTF